eukprot:1160010-Pelagomonas_calceolata.AAC.1
MPWSAEGRSLLLHGSFVGGVTRYVKARQSTRILEMHQRLSGPDQNTGMCCTRTSAAGLHFARCQSILAAGQLLQALPHVARSQSALATGQHCRGRLIKKEQTFQHIATSFIIVIIEANLASNGSIAGTATCCSLSNRTGRRAALQG